MLLFEEVQYRHVPSARRNWLSDRRAEFFSSSVADVALWLGPYMSISSRMQFVQGPHGSRNEGKSHQTKKPTNQPDDPQIPQPDLRFVKRNNKPDTQKGPEPKQEHAQKKLPNDTVVWPLYHFQKHAKTN